jgi:hypothetical protein
MRLVAKDEFVSAAERAHAALDLPHQPESGAALMPPRAPAHRTVQADIGQGLVESGWFLHKHVSPLGAPFSQKRLSVFTVPRAHKSDGDGDQGD